MSEWKETELNKIGTIISGGTPSTSNPEFWDGDILFVTPYDLSRNRTAYIEDTERKISKDGLANSSANIIPAESIVISSRAPIGYIAIGKKEFTTNQGCKSLIPNSGFDSLYLYYCIGHHVERIKRLGAGSTFAEISKADLELVKFPHPLSKAEQWSIAHILATCDAVIEKTQAAIAKYKAIKQGMLHDLFTRGIDINTGKLRPKYEDAPELYKDSKLGWVPREWEVDFLGEIISVSSGEGLIKNRTRPGIHPVYGGNGINGYHSEYLFKEEKLIIGRVGEYCGNAFITQPFSWVTDNALVVTNLEKEFNIDFWESYLNYLDLNSIAFAAAQPVITGGIISKVPIIKVQAKEQNEIAIRIKAINQKIHVEQSYLHKLRSLKQGLMGDLLSGRKSVIADTAVNKDINDDSNSERM